MKILEDKGYTYQRHLSTGGEGEVHLIKSVDKEFIAKIYPALSESSMDVLKTIQKLNIEGIPKIRDIFDYQGKTIIIRDYVEGTTLYDEIRKNEYLSFKRAKAIILNISKTLRQLHNVKPKPIIYRDLKPENIIVTPEGNIQLIDFGIARYYKMESTRDTVLAGTKGYTAPEVMAGMQSDERSDVYSAGLLFYEMLTGKNLLVAPFQIRPVKESNEYLPEWVDAVIGKATDLNQTKRYRTIDEFIAAIESPIIKKKSIKKAVLSGGAVTLCLCIMVILYVFWDKENGEAALSKNTPLNQSSASMQEQITSDASEQPSYSPHENIAESYDTLLNIEFADSSDYEWVYLMNDPAYFDGTYDATVSNFVQDGIFNMNHEFGLKYGLKANSFYHMRIKPADTDEQGTLLLLCFAPQLSNQWSEASYEIKFDNKQPFLGEIRSDYGYYNQSASGSPMLVSDYWVDVIVYLDSEGKTFRYFVFDTENSAKVVYGGIAVFDTWVSCEYQIYVDLFYDYWEEQVGIDMPTSQIDFIRQGEGSVRKYLEENIAGYDKNKTQVDEFLKTEIEFIGEDRFTPHGY